MQFKKEQQGFGMISFLFLLLCFFVIFYTTFKLAPIYIENYMLQGVLKNTSEDLKNTPNADFADYRLKITDKFSKELNVNSISRVTADDLKFVQDAQGVLVELKYDVDVPYMANIDLLVHFDNTVRVMNK